MIHSSVNISRMPPSAADVTGSSYAELVQRQRAELQDAYLRGVRRLRWDADRLAAERQRRLRELLTSGRRAFAVLAGTAGRTEPRDLHRGRPAISADPDQGRDDGELRSPGHRSRFDARPGLRVRRASGCRPVPRWRVPRDQDLGDHWHQWAPRLRMGRVRHVRDAGFPVDRSTWRSSGLGARAGVLVQPEARIRHLLRFQHLRERRPGVALLRRRDAHPGACRRPQFGPARRWRPCKDGRAPSDCWPWKRSPVG